MQMESPLLVVVFTALPSKLIYPIFSEEKRAVFSLFFFALNFEGRWFRN